VGRIVIDVQVAAWEGIDAETRRAVGRLRVAGWASVGTSLPADPAFGHLDRFDPGATHFLAWRQSELVAAARLTVHSPGTPLPDGIGWSDCPGGGPVVVFGRCVVHPSARGARLSSTLDDARLAHVRAVGGEAVLAIVSAPVRRTSLVARGFREVRAATGRFSGRAGWLLRWCPGG